jgi:hypothetical protein
MTLCSSFDQLKKSLFIMWLKDGFEFVPDPLTLLTPGYVNTLTLCKTAFSAPEK